MNGKGKLIWTDKYNGKATYKGNFLVNQFHGPGLLVWSNGDIYDGQFLNGTYHGYGEFAWADGIKKYKGEFEHGKMQGVGCLITPQGIFKGEFNIEGIKY